MTIDRIVLRWARPEALERLARALRVELPPIPKTGGRLDGWIRHASRVLEAAIAGGAPC